MAKRTYRGCVYRATLIRTGMVYIGKTLKGIKARRTVHYWHAANGLKTPFAHALNSYVQEAFFWEELFCSDDDGLLKAVEIEQIAAHKAAGIKLYNISAGGDGCNGVKWTPEERARRSASHAKRKAAGLTALSDDTKRKLSKAAMGRPGPVMSEEGKARIAEAKRAYWAKRKAENLPPLPKDASGKFVKPPPS